MRRKVAGRRLADKPYAQCVEHTCKRNFARTEKLSIMLAADFSPNRGNTATCSGFRSYWSATSRTIPSE